MSPSVRRHPTLWVCAAVLVEDGRVMLTQRLPGSPNAGAWEFPGGKVEPGEAPRAALERELLEELALPVVVGEVLEVAFVERLEGALALLFFEVARSRPLVTPRPRQVAAIQWFGLDAIPLEQLTEGDRVMARRLADSRLRCHAC